MLGRRHAYWSNWLSKNIEKKLDNKNTKVFFGGTFSGNSVSTFVGKETVKYIYKNRKNIL